MADLVEIDAVLRPAPILLIVPPFHALDRPNLGVHLLQGLARQRGVEVQVLYASILWAARFGERDATALMRTNYKLLLGERVFSRAAFGTPPLGHDRGAPIDDVASELSDEALSIGLGMSRDYVLGLEGQIADWLESFVPAIAAGGYQVVGCTSSYDQTAASIAILNRVKELAPATYTIIGGSNCEGEMGEGIAALSDRIDAVFSGESERTFVELLDMLARGERPASRVQMGEPCTELDAIPTPDYGDYYAQMRAFLPESRVLASAYLTYETSRGCWWGQKHHCTFCGLNGQGMASRYKSADRAIAELKVLLEAHPNRHVLMADNIMPHGYWKTLVPRLPDELPKVQMHYEQKANLSLEQISALARGGVTEIQPGIESLSTGLLSLMDKGTTCSQNIAVLRYARVHKMRVAWGLLGAFPGDDPSFYEETLELLPLLVHLPPPFGLTRITIDRFSPYYSNPERYGVTNVRALPAYRAWLPAGAPIERIAYHFEGTYESPGAAAVEVFEAVAEGAAAWRQRWRKGQSPYLHVTVTEDGGYQLVDTRGIEGLLEIQPLDEQQVISALVARPLSSPERPGDAWARSQKVVVERDRKLVPLATAPAALLASFEARARDRRVLTTLAS
ncbi:MAG: RiPP maturation radical SAM C-methyltransferase [Kofleriaceae bacterium]